MWGCKTSKMNYLWASIEAEGNPEMLPLGRNKLEGEVVHAALFGLEETVIQIEIIWTDIDVMDEFLKSDVVSSDHSFPGREASVDVIFVVSYGRFSSRICLLLHRRTNYRVQNENANNHRVKHFDWFK